MKGYFLIFFVLLGLCLRLLNLTSRGIWLDEATSLEIARRSLMDICQGVGFDRHTPPLYYALLHLWFSMLPPSVFSLRFFSLAVDCFNIILIAAAFGRQFGTRIGLLSAIFYSLSAYALYYAQEGRMYSLLTLLVLATYFCALRYREDRGSLTNLLLLVVIGTMGMYTHYYYALSLCGITVGLLAEYNKRPQATLRWLLALLIVAVLYSPWLVVIAQLAAQGGQAFREFLFLVLPYTFFRFAAGYGNFPIVYQAKQEPLTYALWHCPVLLVYFAVFGAAVVCGLKELLAHHPRERMLFLSSLLFPPLIALLLSIKMPMLSERYLIVCFPHFVCLLALMPWRRWANRGGQRLKAAVALLILFALFRHHTNPNFGNTQWREVAAYIQTARQSPLVFVSPAHGRGPAVFYLKAPYQVTGVEKPDDLAHLLSANISEPNQGAWLIERGSPKVSPDFLCANGLQREKPLLFPLENGLWLSFISRSSDSPC